MAARDLITPAYVRNILHYLPEHGIFIWKFRDDRGVKWNGRYPGQKAGYYMPSGYLRIEINNLPFNGHRLAWMHYYGEVPSLQVDHIDGQRWNNRIENLRLATPSENNCNRKVQSNNKLGVKGVFLANERWGLYRVRTELDGKMYEGGYFKTLEEAKIASEELLARVHGKFARS